MENTSPSYLSSGRDAAFIMPQGISGTSFLTEYDFDVDIKTGFMPPEPPLDRLPAAWSEWEDALGDAMERRLSHGCNPDTTAQDAETSATWRLHVREMPVLPTTELLRSEIELRRAHCVLAWLIHYYVHTLPPSADICIPRSISVPQLQICAQLQLPPVLTYSDDVLYNWAYLSPSSPPDAPTPDNIRMLLTFTGTSDEAVFYLTSARIELRGVSALALMRTAMDEAFVEDPLALARISIILTELASVIGDMTELLLKVRDGCDPEVFYNEIRPWMSGEDSNTRKWTFEGVGEAAYPELKDPVERSGPSAGQSSLIQALDAFLGVGEFSHSRSNPATNNGGVPFLTRMQSYMPRRHRAFLVHLFNNPRPLRSLIFAHAATHAELLSAYNCAVTALKRFREAHMRVVAQYIVSPGRKALRTSSQTTGDSDANGDDMKGTGGTDLVKFLRSVRDQTAAAALPLDA